jgi:hypothetical protein
MAPKVIEVHPDQRDFFEDVLKASVVLTSGFFLNQWLSGGREPFGPTQTMLFSLVLGLFVFHYIVDPHVIRFVVKSGTEGYYQAKRRYK